MSRSKLLLFVALIAFIVITCISPVYPHEQFLQHAGTVLLLIPLLYDVAKNRMPMSAFAGLVIFTMLHAIGARYIYSYVPYKEWCVSAGIVGAGFFQDPRNHYDRFVHLSFGLFLFPYLLWLCQRLFRQYLPKQRGPGLGPIFMAWLIVQTGSMVYELFEWLLTIVMTPEQADGYNGQQGDLWDAQKDMAWAMLGSTIMALYYICRKRKRTQSTNIHQYSKHFR